MLCAGVIHGDLSEYNILVDADGPVIIDLPQAVDAAGNTEAGADAGARRRQHGRLPRAGLRRSLLTTQYGKEIWGLYGAGLLTPETVLTGRVAADLRPADVGAVLREIDIARREEEERQRHLQQMS